MAYLLAALLLGSLVYCVLVIVAVGKYRAVRPSPQATFPAISILKPLEGLDEGLESNLRTFFEQDYPNYEILFATRTSDDPAYALVNRLGREYSHIPSRVLLVGEFPPWPNRKVWSLNQMMAEASNDLLVMSDSDIRVTPSMLETVAAEFADPKLAVTTCPYRAVPGNSFWSKLEALGMNTEFLGGIMVARMLEGMRFAVGPTIAARKSVIESIGGWDRLRQYLAEDFVLGKFAADAGHGVALSSYVVEHHIGSESIEANALHRIRWNRSTRRSRPAGYVGQLFTNPLPIALLLVLLAPAWWPMLLLTCAIRAAAGAATAVNVLNDGLTSQQWYLVPLADLISFAFWVAGFFGNTIYWRGQKYRLLADGRFEPAA